MHLYEATTWVIDEPEQSREYVVHSNGELLAKVSRVAIRRPDDAAMPYANPHAQHDESRVVVCAAGPDGSQYFFVDRTADPMRPPPAFVVAPDGSLIGSVVVGSSGGVKGTLRLMAGKRGAEYALLDAHGGALATMACPPVAKPEQEGTVTDSSGTEVARFSITRPPHSDRRRQYTMRLSRPVQEPLRTMLFASLIGMELMIPAS